ncbi:DUF4292 domain-containing protein [Flavobacteriaceae bacterium S356]|uniref:DUF4292 domain-containing protein n=1 Tax=Asprobacillus argus TaxID=3076534 RepID=A0ABU3LD14_9FLAO|nr:DUF4292 domain-containing protein [Flavobacteriaceae bacterium S356]
MKNIVRLLLCVLLLASCKTVKNVTDKTNVDIKKLSARKIVRKHLNHKVNINTMAAKMKVLYSNTTKEGKRTRNSFTARLRMQKDSVIWIKANKVITIFRAKITPNSFSFYVSVPKNKHYFEGDYEMLKRMLGVDINFTQLQNMLFGQSIFEMKGKKYSATIEETSYKLTPKIQEKLFDVFFKINANHFKLDQMYLTNEEKEQNLRVDYKGYKLFDKTWLPIGISINAKEGVKYTYMNLDYKSVTINKPISIPYRVPSAYKRLELK